MGANPAPFARSVFNIIYIIGLIDVSEVGLK